MKKNIWLDGMMELIVGDELGVESFVNPGGRKQSSLSKFL